MNKRPLIAVALFYVAGILLAQLPVPLASLFTVAFTLIFLFVLWAAARRVLLCVLIVFAGWINLSQRTAILSPHDLRTIIGDQEELVTVRGKLLETPYHRVHEIKDREVWSSMARMEASSIRIGETQWQPAHGEIITGTKEFLPETFFAGQIVEVTGVLGKPRGALADGLFDYRKFLDHQGIYHELNVKLVSDWRIVSSPVRSPLSDRFCAWARKTLALGLPAEDESLRLEWALSLGWKAALTDEVSEPFIRAATYHIFAVDGLRIAIVSGIFLALFRVLGVPRAWCGMLTVPFLWFYAAMTGWPASAIRAIVMITVIFGGWALKRPSDLINSLFMAALVILVWEPRQLFQAGFQLSFFVVLCIILILPFFNRVGEYLLRTDPLLPESLQTGWQRMWRVPARCVVDLFLASLAAWLGSIPLVVWYFHLVTPVSGPANVFAVPLCSLVLICNLASLFFAAWLPYFSVLFNHAGWFFMECIRATSTWSANWPAAYFYLPMPALFTIALYYFLLLGTLTGWLFKQQFRAWKISVAILLVLVWCGLWIHERPSARLTVLPLNGGHAVYLQMPNGDDWLIDCGNESAATTVIKPFLQAQGVNRLSNLLLTHGEIAYSGGAPLISELFHPRNLYTSPIHFRSPSYREFETVASEQRDWRNPLQAGDRVGPFTILHPASASKAAFPKASDNALVLLAQIHGVKVLLMSDLGHLGQNALLNLADAKNSNENLLHADIVIAGLPGFEDDEPLSEPLLDAIQPRLIIIADSRQPASKRAGAKLKQRLAVRHVPVLYTSAVDGITLTIRPGQWELRAMDGTSVASTNVTQDSSRKYF